MNNEEIKPFEYGLVTKNGEKIQALYSSRLIDYESGKAIMGTITDITKHNQIINECQQSKKLYSEIADLTGLIIVRADKNGFWTFLNSVACDFWGRSKKELLGKNFFDYLHPDDIKKTQQIIEKGIQLKEKASVRNRQLTPNGWVEVEWLGAPIFDQNNEYVGIQASGRVIKK
jgi:PAS domain S-box-containing protein